MPESRPPSSPRLAKAAALAFLLAACSVYSPLSAQTKPDALKLYLDGQYSAAHEACLAEIRDDPSNLEPYVVISWSLVALERYADAENYALKGYAIRRDARITEILGECAYYLGRNEAALANFQNYVGALSEGGRVGVAFYFMGEIYLRLGRYGHADIAFSSALQYSPGNARWWARLGWAREMAKDSDHAAEAYRKALAIDSRLQDALNGIQRLSGKSP